ncbi:mycofactocin-coupled SDR family oxidoreductase [Nocardioides sp. YIM 152315]|uniref:mycofactocin-coupled SDR family oxidoreductase n=1 Tax=Nocardioides sp. YIM 152315 TaxID=3031760 RepID=UPI0023DA20E7|nr:mycofactocin-coupled SDR family oxidoreductase [Nocardioides sp. YIM 152315]MDF1605343.1 mycofactocin-coupled SDR family oxidoreductase [Nocardioides sp. YIM 152315]
MRVALVTGAAGGIGSATVRALAAQGYAVIGYDVRDATAPEGGVHVVGDVRERTELGAAADLALERWGRLDAVVAAAAVIRGGQPLWETPDEDLQELWDVDVRGVWNTAAVTVPAMLAGPDPSGCRFVAVASAAASYGLFHLAGYTAAKHAVIGIVRGLAADLVATGVTAVAVSPGSTNTPMLEATADLYGLSDPVAFASNQLLRRVLDPTEVAATIAFCCSVEGAALTGSVVHADGGFRP